MFKKYLEDWKAMDPKFQWVIGGILVAGIIAISINAMKEKKKDAESEKNISNVSTSAPVQSSPNSQTGATEFDYSVSPTTPRNQGLEQMELRLQAMEELLKKSRSDDGQYKELSHAKGDPSAAEKKDEINLEEALPKNRLDYKDPPTQDQQPQQNVAPEKSLEKQKKMLIIPSDKAEDAQQNEDEVLLSIPVNSGIDAVLLTGFNARPSGSMSGSVGSSNSANDVGAPFVSRIKGLAIMPNRWKTGEIADCFLGGSAIAVLSTSRAYAVATTISCIAKDGAIYESPIRANAIDNDGTLGIAGNVVSKQGSLLLQASLTGMASGLGKAFSPQQVPSLTSSGSNFQIPSTSIIAGSAVAGGLDQANAQLAKFFLEYAKEIFPVVEVAAGTRLTWIVKETITLKRKRK